MSVHKKLMQARIKLQGMELKKSGENKFQGYKYFELENFLPQTMAIFNEIGLGSVVTFDKEFARLLIVDTDDGSIIEITSPMAEANLKGAHPIQNLGAVESYQRRYLWMAAMEIVEHDILDAQPEIEEKEKPKRPPAKIIGTAGEWQIKVALEPEGEVNDWLEMVDKACDISLEMAKSEEDVMSIFKKNKQLFNAVKSADESFYKTLMAKFGDKKNSFKG
jgi:hypothetical protein